MSSDSSPHILSSFDSELEQLRIDLIQMGNLVLRALDTSVKGVIEHDIALCNDVIANDDAVDRKEKEIDADGMSILLRYGPVASDFRSAVSTLSISRSLERIGDHAVNIAKSGRKILKQGACPEIAMISPLFEVTRELLTMALHAYTETDTVLAREVIKKDDEVDKLHNKLSDGLTSMAGSGGGADVEGILHLLFIGRFLERIGDLASNIGEDVVFIGSAENIRHA